MKTLPFLLVTALVFYTDSIPTVNSRRHPNTTTVLRNKDFIHKSCNATPYYDHCYTSLVLYANSIQQDIGSLTCAAVSVSLQKAQHTFEYVSNLTQQTGLSPLVSSILLDCVEVFDDAKDSVRDSLEKVKESSPRLESFSLQMSDVNVWLSAALTDTYTCCDSSGNGNGDGFDGVPDSDPIKSSVCYYTDDAYKATSNALAFAAIYADTEASVVTVTAEKFCG